MNAPIQKRSPRRIFIVDDHEIIRAGLAGLLEPHWTICGEAANGEDAVQKVEGLRPDVVILDISMPGKGGALVARFIRNHLPKTKIVFYSMHENATIDELAKLVGVDAFVTKGQPTSELIEIIRRLIRLCNHPAHKIHTCCSGNAVCHPPE